MAHYNIKHSNGEFEQAGLVSGGVLAFVLPYTLPLKQDVRPPSPVGSEAMGVIKTERQCFFEMGQPLPASHTTLFAVSRKPHGPLLDTDIFHHVSPAYAARFQSKDDSTEEQYVERLRKELDDRFRGLGPGTVVGCGYISSRSEALCAHFDSIDDGSQSLRRRSSEPPLAWLPLQRATSRR